MKKSSDSVFHLSIAIIAICVTIVSLLSIVYQSVPSGWERLLNTREMWSSLQTKTTLLKHTAQTLVRDGQSNLVAEANAGTSGQAQNGATGGQVRVESIGSGTTAKDVARVETILHKVNAPGLIQKTLKLSLSAPATVQIVNGPKAYLQALLRLGVSKSDATSLVGSTGGFTQNSTIVIPLNQNQSDTDLANTLTHELTHVFLNQRVGALPSWINEGIAVYMGMLGEKQVESTPAFTGYERQLAENILDVAQSGAMRPLTANENVILSGQASYDYELQDWLAVCDLIANHGITSIQQYLQLIHQRTPASQAFTNVFGISAADFNQQLTTLLKGASSPQDEGIALHMTIAGSYQGNIRFLQHGLKSWQGVKAQVGSFTVDIRSDGTVAASLPPVPALQDTSPTDEHTFYISLMPNTKPMWNGQRVTDCGFAFDVHNGLYAFENTWISLADGQTVYRATPSLFGVTIDTAQEINQNNPLVTLLSAQ